MADKLAMGSIVEGMSRAHASMPDPKARKKLESHARAYQSLDPAVRARYERLIEIRETDPARWAQVDLDTRAALYLYEADRDGYAQWQKEQGR